MELEFSKPAPKPNTLEECHQLIDVLWQALRDLTQKLSALERTVKDLQEKLKALYGLQEDGIIVKPQVSSLIIVFRNLNKINYEIKKPYKNTAILAQKSINRLKINKFSENRLRKSNFQPFEFKGENGSLGITDKNRVFRK
jgi:hypothetical protein